MKDKKDIVENWLPRYTGTPLAEFGAYVLLTNFDNYVEWFADAARRLDQGHRPTDAQRDRRWNHPDQLRHGQPECRDRDGPAERHCAEEPCCFSANAAA